MNEVGPALPRLESDRVSRPPRARGGPRRIVLLGGVLLALVGGLALVVTRPWSRVTQAILPTRPESARPLVTTVRVEPRPMTRSLDVVGSLVAQHEVAVGVQVSGQIESVLVDVGDHVAKGDVLARLDPTVLQARLRHANAAVLAASASAGSAEAAFRRVDGIRRSGAVSMEQVMQRQADAISAKAQLEEAQAQAAEIEARLNQLVLRAPVAGVIAARNAEPGAVVNPGAEPLFRLIAGGRVEFDAQVPQQQLMQLAPGMPVRVSLPGAEQRAAADVTGRIQSIAPTLDPRTRTGLVYILLPPDPRLRPGAFVNGRVILSRSAVISVPFSALLWEGRSSFVYVVTGGHAQRRSVTVGAVEGGRAAIRAGIAPGDDVVLSAGAFLHDGEAVRPLAAGGATEAGCPCP